MIQNAAKFILLFLVILIFFSLHGWAQVAVLIALLAVMAYFVWRARR